MSDFTKFHDHDSPPTLGIMEPEKVTHHSPNNNQEISRRRRRREALRKMNGHPHNPVY